jgi:pSer/pThr/pTyr-binding forkhead associated (FHA) protein
VIGRGPDADVYLDNPGVSRDHAVIEMKEGALWIRDLQSSNGTELNGKTVSTATLSDGDLLGIGRFDLRVAALSLIDDSKARMLPPLNPTIRTD